MSTERDEELDHNGKLTDYGLTRLMEVWEFAYVHELSMNDKYANQIKNCLKELQQRRATDRRVIEAYNIVEGYTDKHYLQPRKPNELDKAISELLP